MRALAGSVAAIFAEGRVGRVAEVKRPEWGRDAGQNLLRWGDEPILMGFSPDEVEEVHGLRAMDDWTLLELQVRAIRGGAEQTAHAIHREIKRRALQRRPRYERAA